jgi:hypothetical protein
MCIMLLLGSVGSFGLSPRTSFKTQDHSYFGSPVGEEQTIQISSVDRAEYGALGVVFMIAFLYFLTRTRGEDLRE